MEVPLVRMSSFEQTPRGDVDDQTSISPGERVINNIPGTYTSCRRLGVVNGLPLGTKISTEICSKWLVHNLTTVVGRP